MAKVKSIYICANCGYEAPRWLGQCPDCGHWNTLEESVKEQASVSSSKPNKQRGGMGANALPLSQVETGEELHESSGIEEFDRVLGGGIVEGSLLLIGGEPGVGKSTLLLQVCSHLCRRGKKVLYVSGEESARQLKMRAKRLKAHQDNLYILAENAMDAVEDKLSDLEPDYCVIDSIQTMYRPEMASAPGSVSQVRECASLLMRYAKTSGCAVMLVGHVTKEGAIAGPRVLEHMVDVVLYFEGDYRREYRLLRAVKNRFGSVNELGIFEMTGEGMQAVKQASEALLSERARDASGSVVFCALEGTRPMLVDIQALASQSFYASPRRMVNGVDYGRINLLLAVLEKRAGLRLYNQDVYVNVAGGISLNEPAADLPLCLAVASSLSDTTLPPNMAAVGEVGLAGEVRAVPQLDRRIAECRRLGFTKIICPKERGKKQPAVDGVELLRVETVSQAIALMHMQGKKAAK